MRFGLHQFREFGNRSVTFPVAVLLLHMRLNIKKAVATSPNKNANCRLNCYLFQIAQDADYKVVRVLVLIWLDNNCRDGELESDALNSGRWQCW